MPSRFELGHRRPLAFQCGDVIGVLRVIDPGSLASYADRRRVSVQCTACRYKSTVNECWLRELRARPLTTCSMCTPLGKRNRRPEART